MHFHCISLQANREFNTYVDYKVLGEKHYQITDMVLPFICEMGGKWTENLRGRRAKTLRRLYFEKALKIYRGVGDVNVNGMKGCFCG